MNALLFAWRSLVRQPARATLGLLGVAAIGALLFDMLLLSNGLVTSMRDLFDRAGFGLRVTATEALPGQGPGLPDAVRLVRAVADLPGVRSAFALRLTDAVVDTNLTASMRVSLQGVAGAGVHPWTLRRGRDLGDGLELLINENTATATGAAPGDRMRVHASCDNDQSMPPVWFTVVGVADFPFDGPSRNTAAAPMPAVDEACGGNDAGLADVIVLASRAEFTDTEVAAQVTALAPHLKVLTNEQIVGRMERGGFSYFRQISTVLTTVTLSFAALLISVLLTVSVNQRLGEIAALRALGFTRGRVVADVLWESALIVGGGGVLSLPIGLALALGLDLILKDIPGVPSDVHFFVFQAGALGVHASLLALTAIVAALYPARVVARLPIAATLRDEVIG